MHKLGTGLKGPGTGGVQGGAGLDPTPPVMLFGMTDRDLNKIEERLNAISRVVCKIADKLELRNDLSVTFDLPKIRSDLHLGS